MILSEKDAIWKDNNNIVRIKLNDGFEFNEIDVQRHFDSYAKLGVGTHNKALLLADASVTFVMTKEARDLSEKMAKNYFTAAAIISNSVATRLLINFLNALYDFGIQINMFSTEERATEWILKQG